MSEMYDQMLEYARRFSIPERAPGRIEVGALVYRWLMHQEGPSLADGLPWETPLSALFGVPVVLRDDLDPGVWRLLDRDGDEMKSGTMTRPNRPETPSELGQ